jgi:glutathione synthase/RimK-type ligase-like ATP-grasp enzyme
MPKILIIARPDDNDATYVEQAAQRRGVQVLRWDTSRISVDQSLTLRFGDERPAGLVRLPCAHFDLFAAAPDVDAVWVRSPDSAQVPSIVHRDDRSVVEVENRMFLEGILRSAFPRAFWANRWHDGRAADNKIGQLLLAHELGLPVPRTCISNSAAEVRAFCQSLGGSRVIFKTFRFHSWKAEAGTRKAAYANIVEPARLPSDALMRASPGIFQEFIEKDADVRAIFFDQSSFSILLADQGTDWRRNHVMNEAAAEAYALPSELQAHCRTMMQRLGLHVAAFDFAQDRAGRLHFLEVNEAGRFLWMEELCPELPILDAFVSFLIAARPAFEYVPPANAERVALADVKQRYQRQRAEAVSADAG